MNTQYYAAKFNNMLTLQEKTLGEYSDLVRDRLTIYLQSYQVSRNLYPRVTYVEGSIARVEVFKDYFVTWFTAPKSPSCGVAIHLDEMDIYAVKPIEIL